MDCREDQAILSPRNGAEHTAVGYRLNDFRTLGCRAVVDQRIDGGPTLRSECALVKRDEFVGVGAPLVGIIVVRLATNLTVTFGQNVYIFSEMLPVLYVRSGDSFTHTEPLATRTTGTFGRFPAERLGPITLTAFSSHFKGFAHDSERTLLRRIEWREKPPLSGFCLVSL